MWRTKADSNLLPRRAITLLEVVLLLFAILLVMSLILSAIQKSRPHAVRFRCSNNLKMLGLATTNLAAVNQGRLPRLSNRCPGLASEKKAVWVMELFPYMDRADTHEDIISAKTSAEAFEAVNSILSQKYREYTCDFDRGRAGTGGGLSYGANIGYGAWQGTTSGITTCYDFAPSDHHVAAIDWNNNGKRDQADRDVARATGVFWFADEDEVGISLDDINASDGTGQTILFSETLNLPLMHQAGPAKNGMNPFAREIGIGLGYQSLGLKKHSNPTIFIDGMQPPSDEYAKFFAPNANWGQPSGTAPGVSSAHPEHITTGFVDGHVSSISQNIHWRVWASLHSPDGTRFGQTQIFDSDF